MNFTVDQALTLLLLMLVAQIPILIAGIVGYLKNKSQIDSVHKTINSNLANQMRDIKDNTADAVNAAYAKGREDQRTGNHPGKG